MKLLLALLVATHAHAEAPSCADLFEAPREIHGKRAGTPIERMVFAVQSEADSTNNARVFLNANQDSFQVADYVARSGLITIGREDLGDLRHEIQHHFEQVKINKGEFSLARFVIQNSKPNEDLYSGFLSFDEVEAYLRNLRMDQKIEANKTRAENARARIVALIARERMILDRLKDKLARRDFDNDENGGLIAASFGLGAAPMNSSLIFKLSAHETVLVRVSSKRTLPRRPSMSQLIWLIEQSIEDAEWRLEDIELSIN